MESFESELSERPSKDSSTEKKPQSKTLGISDSCFLEHIFDDLDLGITAVSLLEIRADFDDSKEIINWGATSYLVTMTSLFCYLAVFQIVTAVESCSLSVFHLPHWPFR